MEYLKSKPAIRKWIKRKRDSLCPAIRKQAAKHAFISMTSLLSDSEGLVLSFASFGSELDVWEINRWLASRNQLVLPRVNIDSLDVYFVKNPSTDLIRSKWGIYEPNPEYCEKIDPTSLRALLIPGLAFDLANHRIGYGKGFYDKFLSSLPSPPHSIGIGYTMQKVNLSFPTENTDISLSHLYCF